MPKARPEPEIELTWEHAPRWRARRQLLDDPVPDPVDTVSILGGVQIQVASSALQVLMIQGPDAPDLDDLLWAQKKLVKTWAMRGTLHLLPADELGTWFAVLRRRPWKMTPGWVKYHGVTGPTQRLDRGDTCRAHGDPMTREEPYAAILDKTGDAVLVPALRSGWSQVLKPAANRGLIAQGPPRGRNITFIDPVR